MHIFLISKNPRRKFGVTLIVVLLLQHAADERIRLEDLRQKVNLFILSLSQIFSSVTHETSQILRYCQEKQKQ